MSPDGAFHPDHVGAEIGEDVGRVRAKDNAGQVIDADAGEGAAILAFGHGRSISATATKAFLHTPEDFIRRPLRASARGGFTNRRTMSSAEFCPHKSSRNPTSARYARPADPSRGRCRT